MPFNEGIFVLRSVQKIVYFWERKEEIMETITLQVNSEKAYKLIENLEALNIVKVLKKGNSASAIRKNKTLKPSEYAGRISQKAAELIITELNKNRDEWERSF